MVTRLEFDPEHAEQYLAAAVVAFREGINASITALAEIKGTDDLGWFDELHDEAVRSAKGLIAEQMSVEVEAPAIRFGFQALDAELQGIRLRLAKEE